MTIAAILHRVHTKAPPARAFTLFTEHMSRWWPKGQTPGRSHVDVVVEPVVGGRWFERDAEGLETRWGTVLDWAPPQRLLLGWQLNTQFKYDPDLLTEVELTFAPAADGGTLVTLEHRDLERFGVDAEEMAGKIGRGWPERLADFAAYETAQS